MTSTAKKLLTGSALRVITLIITMGVSLFMMPFIINSLGDEWYGLWVLIGSIFSFYSLLDIGVSNATQRFIAFVLPKKSSDELNQVINTSLGIYIVISLISLLITISIAAAASFFIENESHLQIFSTVVIILGIGMSSNFPFMVLNGILSANLRYDIACYIMLTKTVIRALLVVYFLGAGYSLIAFALITIFTDFLGNVITLVYAKKLAPEITIGKRHFSKERLPELFHYAKYTFISIIGERLRFSSDKFIIAAYLSLSSVTTMQIASQLISYYNSLIGQAISVMLPLFTRYVSEKDFEALRSSFITVSRFSVIISLIVSGGIFIFGDTFITLWLGEKYSGAYTVLSIILLAALVERMQSPSVSLIFALSMHKYYAYLGLAEAFINIFLSLILVHQFGLIGIAFGTAIPIILLRVSFLPILSCRLIEISLRTYLKAISYLVLFCIIFQLPIYFLDKYIVYENLFDLFSTATLCYTPLIIIICNTLLSKNEKQQLLNILPQCKYIMFYK